MAEGRLAARLPHLGRARTRGRPASYPSAAPRAATRLSGAPALLLAPQEPTPNRDPRSPRTPTTEVFDVPSRRITEHERDETDTPRQRLVRDAYLNSPLTHPL
ncbi:hypothetical protein GCM10017557_36470 [Streptomyces aurantiacus]|uniref:Uncharacterized protein n=1 Tax=Streptomyces aurantiacus TaxID=47760 RepID=A0A7G1P054_9ACTN|nr:hypothetical protein GCM10017557_36470 [Streptomyces aurantiacus]